LIMVTVELFPGGARAFRRIIATMEISNLSDLASISDYEVEISEAENPLTGTPARSRTLVLRRHRRSQSIWSLIAKAARGACKVAGST
jgi:hypothetical protein